MGSNGEKPISQEDSLSKEHEKMINVILRFFLNKHNKAFRKESYYTYIN